MSHYDDLETRSADQREASLAERLPRLVARAAALPGYGRGQVDAAEVTTRAVLARLPVLRKSALSEAQAEDPPFGGLTTRRVTGFSHVFQSPGPIYEPGSRDHDWWRLGRFPHAIGVGEGDIVQNCFTYHLAPAGMIFESAAAAVGATVLPAGTGQTELQARAARDVGATVYAGTPDFLKTILDTADELGFMLRFTKAAVSGGALFPSLRQAYADRGITCRQCYATPDYPLVRFATGDLSAVLPGESPCGRTNMRIKGWMGRADQTTKIKGMFLRPEQVADFVARHAEVARARVIADREGDADVMLVQVETEAGEVARYEEAVADVMKLRGRIELVAPGSLPKDGVVVEDRRKYD